MAAYPARFGHHNLDNERYVCIRKEEQERSTQLVLVQFLGQDNFNTNFRTVCSLFTGGNFYV